MYPVLLLLSWHDYEERTHVAHHLAAHIPTGLHATRRYSIPPATLYESCLELEDAARSGMTTIPDVTTGISLRNSGDVRNKLRIGRVMATTDLDSSRNCGPGLIAELRTSRLQPEGRKS
jgi:hypothetical protein